MRQEVAARVGEADVKPVRCREIGIVEAIDALESKYNGEGRVLIRPSGTEPLVRVMIEGRDQAEIDKDAKDLAELIEKTVL